MPYRRFRKNTYRRRFRYRSKLSTRNIFANRSARSQASQIAALRNRVNKVYRACKPEKKVAISNPASFEMNSGIAGDTNFSMSAIDIHLGTLDQCRIGNLIYRKDTYYLTFEYYNSSTTGYHTSESSGTSIRILCGQWKDQHGQTAVPLIGDLISNYSTSGTNMTVSTIAPLATGTSEYFRIAKDFNFNLTASNNQHQLKVSSGWYVCRYDGTDTESDSSSNHSWCWVVSNGLHYDNDFKEWVKVSAIRKTVFTDA